MGSSGEGRTDGRSRSGTGLTERERGGREEK